MSIYERIAYQNKATKEIVVLIGEGTAVKSNTPVVIYMSLTNEDNDNKILSSKDFFEQHNKYKVK